MNEATMSAALDQMARDMLWRSRPCLAEGCEHDWELLPVVEFRQTVICGKCGGLDPERSRTLQSNPLKIIDVPGRGLYVDGVRIVSRIREP